MFVASFLAPTTLGRLPSGHELNGLDMFAFALSLLSFDSFDKTSLGLFAVLANLSFVVGVILFLATVIFGAFRKGGAWCVLLLGFGFAAVAVAIVLFDLAFVPVFMERDFAGFRLFLNPAMWIWLASYFVTLVGVTFIAPLAARVSWRWSWSCRARSRDRGDRPTAAASVPPSTDDRGPPARGATARDLR